MKVCLQKFEGQAKFVVARSDTCEKQLIPVELALLSAWLQLLTFS
jgi:hypothetical protein